jgi:hypothetical protein
MPADIIVRTLANASPIFYVFIPRFLLAAITINDFKRWAPTSSTAAEMGCLLTKEK